MPLAKGPCCPARRINEIVHGLLGITADTALRLARYFKTSERFWQNFQTRYGLDAAQESLRSRLTEKSCNMQANQRRNPPEEGLRRMPRRMNRLFVATRGEYVTAGLYHRGR